MHSLGLRGLAPWLAVVTLTAAGAAAAAGYALTVPKQYRATARLLVSPVPAGDATFEGIDVLRDAGGKHTAAESAAALVRAPQVADAVRAQLGLRRSSTSLLDALQARVADGSDVVEVRFHDTSPIVAAQVANAFAAAFVSQRTAGFQSDLAAAISRDRQLGAPMRARLAALQTLQGHPDPTVRVASQAVAPPSADWPDLVRLIGIGAGIGAVAGVLWALMLLPLRRRGVARAPQYSPAVSERALERLADRLEARLAARESALAARERDVQAKLDELRKALAATSQAPRDDAELVRREQELEARIEGVTKRERELARRAAELAQREQAPQPEPRPEPVRTQPPSAADGTPGNYNLLTLERLVEERGAEYPDRVDVWASTIFSLRDFAAPDGTIPAAFDWLIADTFSELV